MIGYHYFREKDRLWRKHFGTLIPLSMPHCEVSLGPRRAISLLRAHRAYLIRWESDFDNGIQSEWWHVIKSKPEHLEDLSASTRSKVRRGLKRFLVEPVSSEALSQTGYPIYCKAYERYDTFEPMLSQAAFAEALERLPPETEFWVVRDQQSGEPVAFSENLVRDGACFYLSLWCTPESLRQYASYVLVHEMNWHYLNEKCLKYVSDGARSISHNTGIHDFLIERFKFRKAYAQLHVVYSPSLSFVVHALYPFRRLLARMPGNAGQKVNVLLKQEAIRRSFKQRQSLNPASAR